MTSGMPEARPSTVEEFFTLSVRHRHSALMSDGDDWQVVKAFYSAYHLVCAALRCDPIFDSVQELAKVSSLVQLGDRFSTRHQSRRSDSGPLGLNTIVSEIYRDIRFEYVSLHGASVGVRYEYGTSLSGGDSLKRLAAIYDYFGREDSRCVEVRDLVKKEFREI